MKKYFKWMIVIAWMILIFSFSNEPGTMSDAKSMTIVHIFNVLHLNVGGMALNVLNFIVRKTAHFTEYFILYFLVFSALKESLSLKKALWISILVVFLYACSDEFHQTFIPGREGRFRDVLIDTSGGFLCFILNYVINLLKSKRHTFFI